MRVKKSIYKRKSIRHFKRGVIDKKIIRDILNCGHLAPSAKNRQPWYFVVLNEQTKNLISKLMLLHIPHEANSVEETSRAIKEASILILIFRNNEEENWVISDTLSIGACIENMILRATELGLGSLWIRDIYYISKEINLLFSFLNMKVNCALALGYSESFPYRSGRVKLSQKVTWL